MISYFSDRELVFYITYPFYAYILKHLQRATVVYDVLDDLSVFSLYCEAMRIDHLDLLGRSDVTLFSSQELLNANRSHVGGATFLVSNGVWVEDFVIAADDTSRDMDFSKITKYVIWSLSKLRRVRERVKNNLLPLQRSRRELFMNEIKMSRLQPRGQIIC